MMTALSARAFTEKVSKEKKQTIFIKESMTEFIHNACVNELSKVELAFPTYRESEIAAKLAKTYGYKFKLWTEFSINKQGEPLCPFHCTVMW